MKKLCLAMIVFAAAPLLFCTDGNDEGSGKPAVNKLSASDTLQLELVRAVHLESSGALNLSGMTVSPDGWLYFCDDNGPPPPDWEAPNPVVLRLRLEDLLDTDSPAPPLEPVGPAAKAPRWSELADSTVKYHKYDFEGIFAVSPDRLWIAEERDRLLYQLDLRTSELSVVAGPEKLVAWNEMLATGGVNNGFEGIARVGQRLFLSHEMYPTLIASFDLEQDFAPGPLITIPGANDLCGLDESGGRLYALCRTSSLVLRLDPADGRIEAMASFRAQGDSPPYRYVNNRDFYRNSEGLAVSEKHILVVLDGNFKPMLQDSGQRLPLLLVFDRPPGF